MSWKPCPPGSQGFVIIVADARSTFYYTFHFVEEDPNLINPLASMGGLMDVTYQQKSNSMGVVEMQQSRMNNLNLFANAAARGAAIPASVGGGGGGGGRRSHHGGGSAARSHVLMDSALDSSSSSSSSSSSFPPLPVGYERRRVARDDALQATRGRIAQDNERRPLTAQRRTQEAERQQRVAEGNERRAQMAAFGYNNEASVSKAGGIEGQTLIVRIRS